MCRVVRFAVNDSIRVGTPPAGETTKRDPGGAKERVRLWELASFRNFYKSLHTQGINVFRAPFTGNHHTLQGKCGE